ncbi:MAG: phage portal protein [Acetobacterales bacterium]
MAGFLARLGRAFRPQASDNSITTSEELANVVRQSLHGGTADSGVSVNVHNAQGLAAVAACVRVLSDAVAHLPLQVLRRDGERRSPALDLPVYRVLALQPNGWQTSFQLRKLGMRDLLFRGNFYCLKVPAAGGGTQALLRLHPDRMRPVQDPRTMQVSYEYRRPDGGLVVLARDQVFHVWKDSDDGVVGLNPIQVYRDSIGDGLAQREHGSRFFSNAARPSAVLQAQAGTKISDEAVAALREDFERLYGGTGNAHRTATMPPGYEIKPISISMKDAQWLELRKTTAREIFGIFGVPPHKGGDLADATFSNVEHENLGFVVDGLTPWLVCLEQAVGRDLLGGDDELYAKFNVAALLRGDAKSRAEALQIQRRNGVISANEWRAKEDMDPRDDAGGEEYIVEGNMRVQDGSNPQEQAQ